ncbi:MAG: hypothetical protein ACE5OQ_11230 [Woeseia sp.]
MGKSNKAKEIRKIETLQRIGLESHAQKGAYCNACGKKRIAA